MGSSDVAMAMEEAGQRPPRQDRGRYADNGDLVERDEEGFGELNEEDANAAFLHHMVRRASQVTPFILSVSFPCTRAPSRHTHDTRTTHSRRQ